MKVIYSRSKDEKLCLDQHKAIKEFGPEVADSLNDLLNAIDAANDAQDFNLPQYRMHPLKGDKDGIHSITIRKDSKYRIEYLPLDKDENKLICKTDLKTFYKTVKIIKIIKISEHYEK